MIVDVVSDCPRDAEIGENGVPLVEEDVLRLDVAVDDALRVRVVERAGNFPRDGKNIVDAQRTLSGKHIAKRSALDKRHHIERVPFDFARVEQRQDVRMAELRRDRDLTEKSLHVDRGRDFPAHELDRDRALELQVIGEIDRRDSAATELTPDSVSRTERALDLVELLKRHVPSSSEGGNGVNLSSGTVQREVARRCAVMRSLLAGVHPDELSARQLVTSDRRDDLIVRRTRLEA